MDENSDENNKDMESGLEKKMSNAKSISKKISLFVRPPSPELQARNLNVPQNIRKQESQLSIIKIQKLESGIINEGKDSAVS